MEKYTALLPMIASGGRATRVVRIPERFKWDRGRLRGRAPILLKFSEGENQVKPVCLRRLGAASLAPNMHRQSRPAQRGPTACPHGVAQGCDCAPGISLGWCLRRRSVIGAGTPGIHTMRQHYFDPRCWDRVPRGCSVFSCRSYASRSLSFSSNTLSPISVACSAWIHLRR